LNFTAIGKHIYSDVSYCMPQGRWPGAKPQADPAGTRLLMVDEEMTMHERMTPHGLEMTPQGRENTASKNEKQ
jgi:hypothetical protein